MPAPDHLSPRQFTDVHRGLSFGEIPAEDVDAFHANPGAYLNKGRGNAGIHWTDNQNSAFNFATDSDPSGNAHEAYYDEDETPGHQVGLVMHGRVRNSNIVQPGTEEWDNYSGFNAIFDHDHPENETTVREGSPVRIGGMTAISIDPSGYDRVTRHRGLGTRRA